MKISREEQRKLDAIQMQIDLDAITRKQGIRMSTDSLPMTREIAPKPSKEKRHIVKTVRLSLNWKKLMAQYPALADMKIREQTTYLSERLSLSVPLTIDKVKKLHSKGTVHIIRPKELRALDIQEKQAVSQLWNKLIERIDYIDKAKEIAPCQAHENCFTFKRGKDKKVHHISSKYVRQWQDTQFISNDGKVESKQGKVQYIVMEDHGKVIKNGIVKKYLIKRFFSNDEIGYRKLSKNSTMRVPTVSLNDILQDLSLVLVDCVRKGLTDEKELARYLISCGVNLFKDFCKREADRIYNVYDMDAVTVDVAGFGEIVSHDIDEM